jgi:hypothetical protein
LRDRHGIEAATGAAILGMLADDALIAVVHYSEDRPLSDRDKNALSQVRDVLDAVAQLSSRSVATPTHFRSMAPLAVLDETFQAVATARTDEATGDTAVRASTLRADVDAMLNGVADASAVTRLHAFLDRMAEITLVRSEELARPGREQRAEWIRTVSPS